MRYVVSIVQGCIYMDSHRNLRINLDHLRIKREIDSQRCESKIYNITLPKMIKKLAFTRISPKNTNNCYHPLG